jgi:hypothetical protein
VETVGRDWSVLFRGFRRLLQNNAVKFTCVLVTDITIRRQCALIGIAVSILAKKIVLLFMACICSEIVI